MLNLTIMTSIGTEENAQNIPYINDTVFYPVLESCFECHGEDIIYDEVRDETYCHTCGLVQKQAFTSYIPTIRQLSNVKSKEEFMLDYLEELKFIKEEQERIGIR